MPIPNDTVITNNFKVRAVQQATAKILHLELYTGGNRFASRIKRGLRRAAGASIDTMPTIRPIGSSIRFTVYGSQARAGGTSASYIRETALRAAGSITALGARLV